MKAKSLQPIMRCAVVLAASLIFMSAAQAANKYKVLHSFGNQPAQSPQAGLVADSNGNLYGTTAYSQSDSCGQMGCGAVFKLTKSSNAWRYSVIQRFKGTDGRQPSWKLIFDSSGNLYGTTYLGGVHGHGTVFELSPSGGAWKERVLASLGATTGDVQSPLGGLTFDASGNLFGTAYYGGVSGWGGVFEVVRSGNRWSEKVIHSFNRGDGSGPTGVDLVWDSAGNLYGTTTFGGQFDFGVVFELSPSSRGTWNETVLYSFTNGADGAIPQSGVVFDNTGNLYGTTDSAGGSGGWGTVFQLTPSSGHWVFSVLFTFGGANGSRPYAPLTFDSSGNLYGTTLSGGGDNLGVVFKLTQSGGQWTEKVLHGFQERDGGGSSSGLIFDQQGVLYGTAGGGGRLGYGVVFSLTP